MKIDRLGRNSGTKKLSICQKQYAKTILEQHGMSKYNPARTLMVTNTQLPVLTEPEVDITEYQRCIRSLMYLMVCTCPDIAFAVRVLLCHIASLGHVHMQAIKQVFCYLCGTSKYKLEFQTDNTNNAPIIAYIDSDWAGD